MKRIRHNPEQIINKLREADAMLAAGKSIAHVVQHLGVSEATYHRWRTQFGGMKAEEARRRAAPTAPERAVGGTTNTLGATCRVECSFVPSTLFRRRTTPSARPLPACSVRDVLSSLRVKRHKDIPCSEGA
jgi:hypothetical protein